MRYLAIFLIFCLFVGGASAAITYNAGTNIITVTGYTVATPCTFLDVYNADVSGGWGVVTQQCVNQYCYDAQLFIGDGTIETYFSDSGTDARWTNFWSAHFQSTIRGKTNSHINLVDCALAANMGTWAVGLGGHVLTAEYAPDFNMSYCRLSAKSTFRALQCYFISGTMKHCSLYNCYTLDLLNFDIYDCVYTLPDTSENYYAINSQITGGSFEDIKIRDTPIAVYYGAAANSITMKNLVCTNISLYEIRSHNNDADHFFINMVSDSPTWKIDTFGFDGKIYRQYTFDLRTTPNAKITIMNHTDIVFQGYAYDNGSIDEQILTTGVYAETWHGVLIFTSHNPYSIEIKRKGYHTYKQEFTLEEPIKWQIMLLPDRVQVGANIIRPSRRLS